MQLQDTYVKARIDRRLKSESEEVFQRLGLTTTEAIRLFLTQVSLRRGLPFPLDLPVASDDDLLLPRKMRQAAVDSVYDD